VSERQSLEDIKPGDMDALSAALLAQGVDREDDNESPADDEPQPKDVPKPPAAKEGATSGTEAEPKPTGILSKDGKNVIPYGVLEGERQQRRQLLARAEAAEAELARRSQQGDEPDVAELQQMAGSFTAEEVEALASDFPAMKKLHDIVTATVKALPRLTAQRGQSGSAATEDDAADQDAIAREQARSAAQAVIDQLPLLKEWQGSGGDAWAEAIAKDKELAAHPRWKDRTLLERSAEVQRRVAADLGLEIPSLKKQTQTAHKSAPEPQSVGDDPETLSSLVGRSPSNTEDEVRGLNSRELRSRFDRMSSDQIAEDLYRLSRAD
jgi:hypothetical protein